MRGGLTPQQWLLIGAALLGLLFSLLLRRIRERAHETTVSEEPPRLGAPAAVRRPAPKRVLDGPSASGSPARPPGSRVAPGPPSARRQGGVRAVGRRRAREAIVLMAVLGPCRAAVPRGPDAPPL